METGTAIEAARAEALALAGRVLAQRDLSRHALEARLQRAGVSSDVAAATVAALALAGVVDDRRLAQNRAASLAERGLGDAVIDARLAAEGVDEAERLEAVAELAPERERARHVASSLRGRSPEVVGRALFRRGFDGDTVESVLATLDGTSGAELR